MPICDFWSTRAGYGRWKYLTTVCSLLTRILRIRLVLCYSAKQSNGRRGVHFWYLLKLYPKTKIYWLTCSLVERRPFVHCFVHSNSGTTASYTNFISSIVLFFMSCNFMSCKLVRHFHVLQFHVLQFDPSISCPAFLSPPGILIVGLYVILQVLHFQSTWFKLLWVA